jgi:deoxyribose-phosphate aldolase
MDINEIIKTITEQVMAEINKSGTASGGDGQANYARYIDHTLLKPDATEAKIKKVCDEAKQYNFASVCVNPAYIEFVAKELKGSSVNPCVVVGFPLGATTPAVKAFETNEVIEKGAKEVDMVLNIGAAKSGNWNLVEEDIKAVVHASRGRALVKVILETCLLADEEKVKACTISKLAGADFVKTSTGFSTGGATVDDVRLMRATVGEKMGVKASGAVRDYETAKKMIEAGATRLGTSSGVEIVTSKTDKRECINCGNCKVACPVGNVSVIKGVY